MCDELLVWIIDALNVWECSVKIINVYEHYFSVLKGKNRFQCLSILTFWMCNECLLEIINIWNVWECSV